MDEHNLEKRTLERAAIRLFVNLYNLRSRPKLRLLYQQEKPDAVLEDEKRRKLGMEITHLFYDQQEAMMLMGRFSGQHAPESMEHLVGRLNELIRRKEEKKKSYMPDFPISLLIRNTSPVFGLTEFMKSRELIYEPKGVFQDIWFLTHDGSADWFLLHLNELKG
ncbi:hypothetical protein [Paenibacillus hamazuiensis]|uniref:hypothetical protein n=1 Tax=Paenibacillus hamazuiensis TaxID=2936508 RepID=UPI00200D5532|nr:hypothetical protein [Paenibacillus hamazuiensis]